MAYRFYLGLVQQHITTSKVSITTLIRRRRKNRATNVPYGDTKDHAKTHTTERVPAFENPGYDNRSAFDDGGTPGNNDVGLVMFPSYEENTETNAATNAVYTEPFGTARISPAQSASINTESSNAGFDHTKTTFDGNAFLYEVAGGLCKKNKDEQPDYLPINVQKKTDAEEQPRYMSLVSDKSKRANMQVENNTQREEKKEEAPIYVDISSC